MVKKIDVTVLVSDILLELTNEIKQEIFNEIKKAQKKV